MRHLKSLVVGLLMGAAGVALAATATSPYLSGGTPGTSGHVAIFTTDGLGIQDGGALPGGGTGGTNVWTGSNTFNAAILGLDVTTSATAIALDNTVVCGQEIDSNATAAVTATLASTFPAQCTVTIAQQGAGGKVTVVAGTGTLHTACTTVGTRAQYSVIRVKSAAAAGTAIVSGDCG